MVSEIYKRWPTVRSIYDRRWVKLAVKIYGAIAAWDAFVSQFVPEWLAKKFPKVYQVVEMTAGWVGWQGYLIIFLAILALASVEYAFRKNGTSLQSERQQISGGRRRVALWLGLALGVVLVVGCGSALLWSVPPAVANDPLIKNVSGPPIEWRFDKPVTILFYSRKPGQAVLVEAIQIHATNKSDFALKKVQAIITADMKSGELFTMRVNPHGTYIDPQDSASLIPPRADFDLMMQVGPSGGISAEDFLQQYGTLRFTFTYEQNDSPHSFSEQFSFSYLEDQIAFVEVSTKEQRRSPLPQIKREPLDKKPESPPITKSFQIEANDTKARVDQRTNAALRSYVIAYAARMRTFESNSTAQEREITERGMQQIRGEAEEQKRSQISAKMSSDANRIRENARLSFSNNLFPEARVLNDELRDRLTRVGILPPQENEVYQQKMMQRASLVGPYPISKLADYIEGMARQLPD